MLAGYSRFTSTKYPMVKCVGIFSTPPIDTSIGNTKLPTGRSFSCIITPYKLLASTLNPNVDGSSGLNPGKFRFFALKYRVSKPEVMPPLTDGSIMCKCFGSVINSTRALVILSATSFAIFGAVKNWATTCRFGSSAFDSTLSCKQATQHPASDSSRNNPALFNIRISPTYVLPFPIPCC